jgi:hypothetical protein
MQRIINIYNNHSLPEQINNKIVQKLNNWKPNLSYTLNRIVVVSDIYDNIISIYEMGVYFSIACLNEKYTSDKTDYENEINYVLDFFVNDLKKINMPYSICNNIEFKLFIYIKKPHDENQLKETLTKLGTKIDHLYVSCIKFNFSPDYKLLSNVKPILNESKQNSLFNSRFINTGFNTGTSNSTHNLGLNTEKSNSNKNSLFNSSFKTGFNTVTSNSTQNLGFNNSKYNSLFSTGFNDSSKINYGFNQSTQPSTFTGFQTFSYK